MKKRYFVLALALVAFALLLLPSLRREPAAEPVADRPAPAAPEQVSAPAPVQAPADLGADAQRPPAAARLTAEEQDPDALPACPATAPKDRSACDAVEYAVRTCAYTLGETELVCECTTNSGREPVWTCRNTAGRAVDDPCPKAAPSTGSTCPVAQQSCMYGEGASANFCTCELGATTRWKCRPYGEVYPLPK